MIIFYICATLSPFILPESFIEWAMSKFLKLKSFVGRIVKKGLISRGNELALKLSSYYRGIVLEEDNRSEWPNYKFFTSLALELRRLARTFGSPLDDAWTQIKLGLNKDLVLQRDITKEKRGSYIQFTLITLITWVFIFFSSQVVGELDSFSILVIVFVEALGALLFFGLTHIYEKYRFKFFDYYFVVIYRLEALIEANLSMSECLEHSGYGKDNFKTPTRFSNFERRLTFTLDQWRNQGHSPCEDLKICCQMLWEFYERELARYKTFIVGARFLILALFYLGSYFFFILSLALRSIHL